MSEASSKEEKLRILGALDVFVTVIN